MDELQTPVNSDFNHMFIEFLALVEDGMHASDEIYFKLGARAVNGIPMKYVFGGIMHKSYLARVARHNKELFNVIRVYLLNAFVVACNAYYELSNDADDPQLSKTFMIIADSFLTDVRLLIDVGKDKPEE